MSDNIVKFPGLTVIPTEPDKVLRAAIEAKLSRVLILGKTESGLHYAAGSHSDIAEYFVLVERFKKAQLDYLDTTEKLSG